MKHIGFLSFGHWTQSPQSQTRSASDALLQSVELAVAAGELGADGAYFRVHHFARQLSSPFPLLAACGVRTNRIELGTAVIDMRYENPLYMAEDAGAADVIAGGRLQLGISRGSPEQVIDGFHYFGYAPPDGMTDADMARRHTEVFLEVLLGKGFAKPNPRPMFPNPPGLLRLEPYSEGLRERIWWGAGTNATAEWAAKLGMNLQSSTLKIDEASRFMCSRPSRFGSIVRHRRRPGTRAPRGCQSPAASSRWLTSATACISTAAVTRATRSVCSVKASVMPSSRSSGWTRPSPKQTRSSSPFPINSGSTTTLTSSRRSLSTSRRGLAGGDAFALGSHVTFVSGVRNIRFEFRVQCGEPWSVPGAVDFGVADHGECAGREQAA